MPGSRRVTPAVPGRARTAQRPVSRRDRAAAGAGPVADGGTVPDAGRRIPERQAEAPPPHGRGRPHAWPPAARCRAAWIAGFGVGGIVLFLCYLALSRTVPVNSDGAANALQAWDMLHGNLLLQGWQLSDVSFYTTELPQYMLVEAIRGLGPDVVHVAAAMSYTLLVLFAALLARGRATGAEAVVRVLLAAAIMLAPQLGDASYTLLLSPDHLGTGVPLLLIWLIIDRGPPRWYVPVLAGLLLAWVQVADQVALLTGVLPMVLACAVAAGRKVARASARHGPGRLAACWYEARLAAAALASVPAAALAGWLIRRSGGYSVGPPHAALTRTRTLASHARLAGHGLLELFGASFSGLSPGPAWFFAAAHLVSLVLVGWALSIALRRFLRSDDLLVPAFAAGIVINVAAYIVSSTASNIRSTREMAAVLPFGAVLCGRLLGGQVLKAGRPVRPVLLFTGAAGLLCYSAALGYEAARPPVAAENQQLASWLTGHHLTDGLAGYWQADSLQLDSRGRILIAPVNGTKRRVVPFAGWESKTSWFDPRRHDATFMVTQPATMGGERAGPAARAAAHTFGPPARTYHVGRYTVLVWDKNLLKILRQGA